jgi:periplasmic divalent cation tolerance protein
MSAVMIYITCKDAQEADRVGRALIGSRLAACVNILDGMRSMFHWQAEVATDEETVLIAKTKVGLVGRVTEQVQQIHSYDCPCVVALPIIDGNPEFLEWIANETT